MLFYVLLAVLGGVIVPALVRHLSLSGFQDYLGRRRTSDLEELGSCLESLYREDEGWNPRRVMDVLRSSAGGMASDIVLLDSGGNRVLPMGHGRGWGMRGKNRVSIPLSLEERRIGTLDANGRPPSSRLEREFVSQKV